MLKKTLHSAVAAIAVSMLCLPVAEAKEDLVLDFDTAKTYEVTKRFSGIGMEASDGFTDFNGKTLESHKVARGFYGDNQVVQGGHAACEARHTVFIPFESTIVLRGDNPKNTLTLNSGRWEDSRDPTNEMATGLCLEPIEGTGQYIVDTKVALDIADATGKWSCAYLNEARLTAGSDNSFVQNPDTTIVGSSNLFVTPVESKIMGTVIIPRSTGC